MPLECVWVCGECKTEGYFDLPERAHGLTGFKKALESHRTASPTCDAGQNCTMAPAPEKYKGRCYFEIGMDRHAA